MSGPVSEAQGVKLVSLGTAQDGGVPQAGCWCPTCRLARRAPRRAARLPACLGLIDSGGGVAFLVDATPDFPEQLERLQGSPRPQPRLSGVILTHAHIGHYAGLMYLGREVMGARGLPVWCTPDMAGFLRENAPWSQLVRLGNVDLRPEVMPGRPFSPSARLTLTAFPVPHRNEFADTVAYRLDGPTGRALYVPDIDRWDLWSRSVAAEVSQVDLAILDGTFYSVEELTSRGRDPKEVPHPPITETMDRLQTAVEVGAQVFFTHLNHTNPVLRKDSPERAAVENRGFHILDEGAVFRL